MTKTRKTQGRSTALVWFRDDLRLADHPAFHEAAASGCSVLAVYVLDNATGRTLGAAARWFLAGALESLQASLNTKGVPLVLLQGDAGRLVPELARACGASSVHWNDRIEAAHITQDAKIAHNLQKAGLSVERHMAMLWRRPGAVKTQGGEPYRVFGAYWRAVQKAGDPPPPLDVPKHISGIADMPEIAAKDLLDVSRLRPTRPNWAREWDQIWSPDEDTAQARLQDFVDHDLAQYDTARNEMGREGTSRLSADLRFGLLSPRQVELAARKAQPQAVGFRSELAWREFAYDTLARAPDLATKSLRPPFEHLPWREAPKDLAAWQQGRTGVPIVDAGMRQLWQEGWMHNRARMIVGSFLVKHLLIDWRIGEAWFWDTLVDADPANNPTNWQWVAGVGIEASPFFRIFNPVLQGRKFDADGAYVRRYVPEIARLSDKALHEPWTQPESVLRGAGIKLGQTYPHPIVDLKGGRERALAAYHTIGEG